MSSCAGKIGLADVVQVGEGSIVAGRAQKQEIRLNAKHLLKLVTAIFLCAAVPALADQDRDRKVAGTLQWGEESVPLTDVRCGEREDAFRMRATLLKAFSRAVYRFSPMPLTVSRADAT